MEAQDTFMTPTLLPGRPEGNLVEANREPQGESVRIYYLRAEDGHSFILQKTESGALNVRKSFAFRKVAFFARVPRIRDKGHEWTCPLF